MPTTLSCSQMSNLQLPAKRPIELEFQSTSKFHGLPCSAFRTLLPANNQGRTHVLPASINSCGVEQFRVVPPSHRNGGTLGAATRAESCSLFSDDAGARNLNTRSRANN